MTSSAILTEVSTNRSFNGYQKVFEHHSTQLGCDMKFGAYIPDHEPEQKLPVLFYLSGLTCTEANFLQKSGCQRFASQHGVIVVNPDTSPRGVKVEGDDESWDLGVSAGHYLDATEPKWAKHYRMYSYFVEEFVPLIFNQFPVDQAKVGIFGHSMGGHGALTIGLRNPSIFKSISAFAAICNPSAASLTNKAFTAYLGDDRSNWAKYDAVEVSKVYAGPKRTILLDQGTADTFYTGKNLMPENLIEVQNPNIEFDFRLRETYDHSYFYIATFIEEHFQFHVKSWNSGS
ncbi:putative esterase domain-containing protein [Ditylenchus destructor]|nr:putative esterase domain-containing protein [Ditylenchus destructor]